MTIADLIRDKDYDYVSYRLQLDDNENSVFAGCFAAEGGKIKPLDGDTYDENEEVLFHEEWTNPEAGIKAGLTVVVPVE